MWLRLQDRHIQSLLSTAFMGVSGDFRFENYSATALRRSTRTVRVSVLVQPDTAAVPASRDVAPALTPAATVSLSPGGSVLAAIPNSALIRWPYGQTYPSTVPSVLSRAEPQREQSAAGPADAPAAPLASAAAPGTDGIVIGLAVLGAVVGMMVLLGIAYMCVRLRRRAARPMSKRSASAPYLAMSGGGLGGQGSMSSGHRAVRREHGVRSEGLHSAGEDVAGVQYVEMLYRNTADSSSAASHSGSWFGWLRGMVGNVHTPAPRRGGSGAGSGHGGLVPGSLVNIGTGRGMWEVVGLSGRSPGGSLTPSEDASGGALRDGQSGPGHCVVPRVPLGKRLSRTAGESDAMDTRRSTSSVTGSGTSALQVRMLRSRALL